MERVMKPQNYVLTHGGHKVLIPDDLIDDVLDNVGNAVTYRFIQTSEEGLKEEVVLEMLMVIAAFKKCETNVPEDGRLDVVS